MSVADIASVQVSSEDPSYPIDHAFDNHRGPGGTRWMAGEVGASKPLYWPSISQAGRVQKELGLGDRGTGDEPDSRICPEPSHAMVATRTARCSGRI